MKRQRGVFIHSFDRPKFSKKRFEELSTGAQDKGDYSSAIRAEENLSKHIGFYKEDNKQQTGTVEDSPKPAEAIEQSKEKIRLADVG